MKHLKAEALVIGGGLAGLMAAKHLAEAGLRPLILADGQGVSPWVHGFNAPVHPEDSPQAFYEDTLASGQGVNDPALAKALCQGALTAFEEVRALGLAFNRREDGGYQLLKPLGASHPRVVSIGNHTGPALMEKLNQALAGRCDRLAGCRALRLRVAGNRVLGALAYDRQAQAFFTVEAPGVILACGGFCGLYPFSTNKRDSGGDGIAMAYEAGCRLTDMEFIQFEPSAAVWPPALRGTSVITTLFYEGAVLRDGAGQRFMEERVNKDCMARQIAQVLQEGRGTPHGGVYFDATGVGEAKLCQDYPAYVERYARVGIDITREMMEIAPAPHTALGGVQVTPQGQTNVAGLFACGEVIGSLHGANRIGGSAGLETLVFGRLAGEACARETRGAAAVSQGWEGWAIPLMVAPQGGGEAQLLRERLRQALSQGAGVLRCEKGLANALSVLEELAAQAQGLPGGDSPQGFARLRLLNDIQTVRLVCQGALARRESLGCHTRTDEWGAPGRPYRIIQSLNGCVKEEMKP